MVLAKKTQAFGIKRIGCALAIQGVQIGQNGVVVVRAIHQPTATEVCLARLRATVRSASSPGGRPAIAANNRYSFADRSRMFSVSVRVLSLSQKLKH